MNVLLLRAFIVAAAVGWVVGCQHLDVSSHGYPDRLLRGTVTSQATVPAGAEIVVRLIDPATAGEAIAPVRSDLPLGDRARPPAIERPVGEYRIVLDAMTTEPVPFELEYRAEDTTLRHGLNVDVKISYGGRLRFRTLSAHVVTLASSPFPQDIAVQPVS